MIPIGERIRRVRLAKRLTQPQLGEALGVVHTTVHTWEKATDLKLSIVKDVAGALEIDETYLTRDESELDQDSGPEKVASRESLRRFLSMLSLTDNAERQQYERVQEHSNAPRTIKEWWEFRELVREFLGRPPDSAPEAVQFTADASPPGMPRKRRMARVTQPVSVRRDMRQRVG